MNILEQQQLRENQIKPPDIDLRVLMEISLSNYMAGFRETLKQIPSKDANSDPINENAIQYRSKIINQISIIFNSDRAEFAKYLDKFIRAFIGFVQDVPYESIENATQAQWETFVENTIPKIFEEFAGTTSEGKAEYDNL